MVSRPHRKPFRSSQRLPWQPSPATVIFFRSDDCFAARTASGCRTADTGMTIPCQFTSQSPRGTSIGASKPNRDDRANRLLRVGILPTVRSPRLDRDEEIIKATFDTTRIHVPGIARPEPVISSSRGRYVNCDSQEMHLKAGGETPSSSRGPSSGFRTTSPFRGSVPRESTTRSKADE